MNALSPETAARLDALVRSGRFASADEAVAYALDHLPVSQQDFDAVKAKLDARLDALSASPREHDITLTLGDLKSLYDASS